MARTYKQLTIVETDPEITKGLAELNKVLRKMQNEDKYEIISIKRNGNSYDILYQVTLETDEALKRETNNGEM